MGEKTRGRAGPNNQKASHTVSHTRSGSVRAARAETAYLRLHVGVVVALEEEGGGLGVVFPCGDVQRGEAHLPLRIVLQQQGDHLIVALLQRHRQRSKTILWANTTSRGHHQVCV